MPLQRALWDLKKVTGLTLDHYPEDFPFRFTLGEIRKYTVNSKIYARILFSRNFADAEFCKIKTSQNGKITLSFTDVGKSCPSRES